MDPEFEKTIERSLSDVSNALGADLSPEGQRRMRHVLDDAHSMVTQLAPETLYQLGIAWRNYTAWYIRGDDRAAYLDVSVSVLRKAFNDGRESLPVLADAEPHVYHVDQITIASELGRMLVDEKMVRDLDAAEELLKFVWISTQTYEPCFIAYAQLFYFRKDFLTSAGLGLLIDERIKSDPEWNDRPFDVGLGVAAKAYRAQGKLAKKEGDLEQASSMFKKIIDLGLATDNDLKTRSKLEAEQST